MFLKSLEFANTIFRGNNLASKMFTTYARLTGLKYLFDTLARNLNQVIIYSKRKNIKADDDVELIDFQVEIDENKIDANSNVLKNIEQRRRSRKRKNIFFF